MVNVRGSMNYVRSVCVIADHTHTTAGLENKLHHMMVIFQVNDLYIICIFHPSNVDFEIWQSCVEMSQIWDSLYRGSL